MSYYRKARTPRKISPVRGWCVYSVRCASMIGKAAEINDVITANQEPLDAYQEDKG